ncbi:MAG: DegV family protein [Dehalococcoidia bacterium]|nr:MAG: DegV family protein [Dehalococcoidia bacterium]
MDPFAIVCDSSHDLPPEIVEDLRLTVVPYTINFGVESGLDEGAVTLEEFAELLDRYEKGKGYPTTAAPAPSRFFEAFMSHVKKGLSHILVVTISSKLSKTYDAAVRAAEMLKEEYPESEIEVVDSLTVSMAEGMLVLEAARARDLGYPLQKAKGLVEEMRGRVRILAALETTKYLMKSGRARRFQHLLSIALQIRPIITARDGSMALYSRVRGRMERAADRMVDEVQRTYRSGTVSVVEGIAPDLREMLVDKLCRRLDLKRAQIIETKTTSTFMVHLGKRVVGVVWEQEPRSA